MSRRALAAQVALLGVILALALAGMANAVRHVAAYLPNL